MLVENQIIETRWHSRNKVHLESKGYKYTHTGEIVFVKLEDMMAGSKCKVRVICDYCGEEIVKTYKDYFAQKNYGKDCCLKCAVKVRMMTNQERYGGNSPANSPYVVEKMKATNLERYGTTSPTKLPEVQEKVRKTNLERYGVENPNCLPEVKAKVRATLYKNGTCPTSKQQIEIYNMLCDIYGTKNVALNKPFGNVSLDCQLKIDENIIDIEYDGWYWHKDRQERDKRRNWYLIRSGFKVLRIRSNYDMPTKEQLIDAIDYLIKNNLSLAYIDLDI